METLRKLRSLLPVSPLPWHWQSRMSRTALVVIVVLVVGWAIASILTQDDSSPSEKGSARSAQAPPGGKGEPEDLTLDDRAGQLVAEGFDDPETMASELETVQLGGVLVGPENWTGSGDNSTLSELRSPGAAGGRIPPLVIADEGLPSESASGMKSAGFDVIVGPVADVATPDSPLGDRVFSDDPATAAEMTAETIRTCVEADLACAPSHFPGLGGASGDTDSGPATVSLDRASLRARDLLPFRSAFTEGAPAVVLSLAFYAAYDPVTPGALSAAIAQGLLRKKLKFDGVAITDDLSAGAISAGIGAPDAAVQALAAGADMVLVSDPAETQATRDAVLAAARSGQIPRYRLKQAVDRVLELKRQLGLIE